MAHFIYNTLPHTILFRAGYVEAKPLTWTQVSELDVVNRVFADALSLQQVFMTEADSTPSMPPAGAPVAEIVEPKFETFGNSMSQEEYIAQMAAEKQAREDAERQAKALQALEEVDASATETEAVATSTEQVPAKRGRKATA